MARIIIDAVETLPTRNLVGYCSILDRRGAGLCYELLWRRFLERLSLASLPRDRGLYGVCANLSPDGFFEYWTAVELPAGDPAPADLARLPLTAGTYGWRLEKPANSLPMVYGGAIRGWVAPSDYALDWDRPFLETHQPDWPNREAVKIAVPLWAPMMARGAGAGI
jgi:hypothetical protein